MLSEQRRGSCNLVKLSSLWKPNQLLVLELITSELKVEVKWSPNSSPTIKSISFITFNETIFKPGLHQYQIIPCAWRINNMIEKLERKRIPSPKNISWEINHFFGDKERKGMSLHPPISTKIFCPYWVKRRRVWLIFIWNRTETIYNDSKNYPYVCKLFLKYPTFFMFLVLLCESHLPIPWAFWFWTFSFGSNYWLYFRPR